MLKMTAKRSATVALFAWLGACGAHDEGADATRIEVERPLPQATPSEPAGAPTRASLEATIDALLDALQSGATDTLLAAGARVTEDGKEVKLSASKLAGARGFPYRAFFAEPSAGQAGVLGAVETAALPLEFALRAKVDAAGKLTEVEIVTVRSGEFLFAAPAALTTPHASFETTVPAAERATREQLVAIADSFFSGIEAASAAAVPFADGCVRFENGLQTTNNPLQHATMALDCTASLGTLGYIETIRDRRFPLVDVERGLVLSLSLFDVPGGPYLAHLPSGTTIPMNLPTNTWQVAHVFKIVGGKIERTEAVLRFEPLGTQSAWPSAATPAN